MFVQLFTGQMNLFSCLFNFTWFVLGGMVSWPGERKTLYFFVSQLPSSLAAISWRARSRKFSLRQSSQINYIMASSNDYSTDLKWTLEPKINITWDPH